MFFSHENIEHARSKILADQSSSRTQQEQIDLRELDEQKENIHQNLAASERFCLPIRATAGKPLICSWFAANGLTCDKNVFVEQECGFYHCCWTASLKKKSFWSRFRLFSE